jgi:spore coat polysaccharide biosynthesis predicted glycosyltransferase SpsG
MGMGHVSRQLNLVRALRSHGKFERAHIEFFTDDNPAVISAVETAGFKRNAVPAGGDEAAQRIAERWETDLPDIFVLDSADLYKSPGTARLFSRSITSVAVTDDPERTASEASVVVNALPIFQPEIVNVGNTRYCYGIDFFILESRFGELHVHDKNIAEVCKSGFAFFGGADLENFTRTFVQATASIGSIEWTCLLGAQYVNPSEARAFADSLGVRVNWTERVPDMARQLFDADVAVLAGGNTLIEAAAVGLPAVVLCQNEIQRRNGSFFEETCGLPCLGLKHEFDSARLAAAISELAQDAATRKRISRALKKIVDGRGAERVAGIIADTYHGQNPMSD